jgi:hypothetical protein
MRMTGRMALGCVALLFAVTACGSSETPAMTGSAQSGCTPGASLTCACASGGPGVATCMAGGQVGLCSCPAVQAGAPGTTLNGTGTGATMAPLPSTMASTTSTIPPAADGGVVQQNTGGAGGSAMVAGSTTSAVTAGTVAAAGAPASGAAGKPAAAAGQCPAGEMCQTSSIGGFKFCSAMTQALPNSCPTGNQPCGSDNKGTCFDAMPTLGLPGLYCLYLSCMP